MGSIDNNVREILLVDDDPRVIEVVTLALRGVPVHIESATSYATALEKLVSHSLALVVLDISLGEDKNAGYKLCRFIRGRVDNTVGMLADIPIIILSGRSSSADRERGLIAGADVYLVKPVRSDVVARQIVELLYRSAEGEADGT